MNVPPAHPQSRLVHPRARDVTNDLHGASGPSNPDSQTVNSMRERLRETWADPTQWHAGVASLRVLAAEAHIGRIAEPAALKRKLEWIARQREDFHILLIRAAHRAIDGCLRWAYVPRDTGLHARKSILIAAEALAAGTPLEAILTEFSIVDPYARTVLALVTDLGSAAYFLPTALRWDAIASKYTLDIAAYATDGPRLDALVAKVAMPSSRPPGLCTPLGIRIV